MLESQETSLRPFFRSDFVSGGCLVIRCETRGLALKSSQPLLEASLGKQGPALYVEPFPS